MIERIVSDKKATSSSTSKVSSSLERNVMVFAMACGATVCLCVLRLRVCVCACVCCWDGLIRGIYFRWSTDVLKLFNLLRSKYYLYNDDDVNCPAPFL
mmetsp:Transcript_4909/g.17816  ORF Transcript_4909/g.17816 Transcript_4909/m.17816 type:complete len:98 (-) Transcript_4909:2345-2638(-)